MQTFGLEIWLHCVKFFPVAYVMGDGLSSNIMCGHFWVILVLQDLAGGAIFLMQTLTIPSAIVRDCQCIGCNRRATKH